MRVRIIALALVASLGIFMASVHAANTITITLGGTPVVLTIPAAQVPDLVSLWQRHNARLAAQSPPGVALTKEEYVAVLITKMLTGYQTESRGLDAQDACVAYRALSVGDKAIVDGKLGGKVACPQ